MEVTSDSLLKRTAGVEDHRPASRLRRRWRPRVALVMSGPWGTSRPLLLSPKLDNTGAGASLLVAREQR
jgi:hypothetical protein